MKDLFYFLLAEIVGFFEDYSVEIIFILQIIFFAAVGGFVWYYLGSEYGWNEFERVVLFAALIAVYIVIIIFYYKKDSRQPTINQPTHLVGNIFVSYRREDSADITGRIYDHLATEFGKESIFKNVDSIPPGVDFIEYIDHSVSESSVFILVIGQNWLGYSSKLKKRRIDDPKDFVRIEVASALKRNIPIIPILVSGAEMPAEENLPKELRTLSHKNAIPIRLDPDFTHDVARLFKGIAKLSG